MTDYNIYINKNDTVSEIEETIREVYLNTHLREPEVCFIETISGRMEMIDVEYISGINIERIADSIHLSVITKQDE